MKVLYNKKITGNNFTNDNLIFNKLYIARIWSNGYKQYLIRDENDNDTWVSTKRFSNRKEKLIEINKINVS